MTFGSSRGISCGLVYKNILVLREHLDDSFSRLRIHCLAHPHRPTGFRADHYLFVFLGRLRALIVLGILGDIYPEAA